MSIIISLILGLALLYIGRIFVAGTLSDSAGPPRFGGAELNGEGLVRHLDGTVTRFAISGGLSGEHVNNIYRKKFGLAWIFPRMWGAITHPTSVRNAIADLVVDLIDAGAGAGTLEFQTSGDVEVATCTFSDPAFGAAASGTATASAITDDSSATGGTVAKFIIQDSDSNQVMTGTVTVTSGGGDIELTSVVIAATEVVSMSSLTYTAPN